MKLFLALAAMLQGCAAYEPPVKTYGELGAELVQAQKRVRYLESLYDGDVGRSLAILRGVPRLSEPRLEGQVTEVVQRLQEAEDRCGFLDAPGLHSFSDASGCNVCELLGLYEDGKAMLVRCTLRQCDGGSFEFSPGEPHE